MPSLLQIILSIIVATGDDTVACLFVGQHMCLIANPINVGIRGQLVVASNIERSDFVHLAAGALLQ